MLVDGLSRRLYKKSECEDSFGNWLSVAYNEVYGLVKCSNDENASYLVEGIW